MKILKKIAIVVVVGLIFYFIKSQGWLDYLSFDALKENQNLLMAKMGQNPWLFRIGFFILYIVVAALSLPGASILTLAAGFLFGLWEGVLIVSFASTIGATCSFLFSRYFFRESVERKFSKQIAPILEGFRKEGAFYLFSLRLVPLFPFFLVNLMMGLTPLKTITYYWVSQLGMLPGTIAYVNAGGALSQLDSLKGILSPSLLGAFVLLGIFPILAKKLVEFFKARKIYAPYKKPKSFDYNVIAIGAGAAGLVTSYIAAAVKAKVALIERHKMGGDCLNTGCVPSKAIIKSAKVMQTLRNLSQYGINGEDFNVNFEKVMERVHEVIKKIEPHDSVERYSKLGVDCISGTAKILSPYEVEVDGKVLTTKNIVIATGARPFVPPIPGLDKVDYLTSDNVWDLKKLPKKLLVLGGGPIGCELAQSFSRLGAEVIQVEMSSRLMIREDIEVSEFVYNKFTNEGMKVLLNHKAVEFGKDDQGQKWLKCEFDNNTVTIEFDEVLLAIGRKANTSNIGLEELGITLARNGTIEHDEFLRTQFPNVFVCGDVGGPYQFTHTAAHQAWYAAVNALFSPLKKFKVDYRVIPWCTFVDPEVARVGINEQEAKEKNIDYDITHYGLDDLDRAIADSEDYGFVKVITVKGKDTILGATIVGTHAGDMISEFVLAMKYNLGLNKILGTIHLYPSFPEANKYAAGLWKQANKPEKLLSYVEKFHNWRRG